MKYIILSLSFLLFIGSVMGQDRTFRKYTTQEIAQKLLRENQRFRSSKKQMERIISQYNIVGEKNTITIPVIFHSLYHNEEEKVSTALINSQLEALNKAFNLQTDWIHPAHSIENLDEVIPKETGIQFCLADVDLMKNGQYGINYVQTDTIEWKGYQTIKSNKTEGVSPHKPQSYLNVWIGNLGEEIGGHAQFPWGERKTDGIVINYRFFGQRSENFVSYNLGKTLVHLVGSYLGLNELWNESNHCGDDAVFDTPIHNAPNYGTTDYYGHFSACNDNPIEMSMNFMDATDDAYVYMFTYGQLNRMRAVLSHNALRKNLTKSEVICDPNENIVEDIANNRTNGETVQKIKSSFDLLVSPNPATGHIQLEMNGKAGKIQLGIF